MAFPRTIIEDLSVSRMSVGSHGFFGWSHTSNAKDQHSKTTMDTKKIADVLEVFQNAGIDTHMVQLQYPGQKQAIEEAPQRTGRQVILISTPGLTSVMCKQPGAKA